MKSAEAYAPIASPVKVAKGSRGDRKTFAAGSISSDLLNPSQDALIRRNAENAKVPTEYYPFPGAMASGMGMNTLEMAASRVL